MLAAQACPIPLRDHIAVHALQLHFRRRRFSPPEEDEQTLDGTQRSKRNGAASVSALRSSEPSSRAPPLQLPASAGSCRPHRSSVTSLHSCTTPAAMASIAADFWRWRCLMYPVCLFLHHSSFITGTIRELQHGSTSVVCLRMRQFSPAQSLQGGLHWIPGLDCTATSRAMRCRPL